MVTVSIKDIIDKAKNEPPFIAELIQNPKEALQKNNLELSKSDTKKLEIFILNTQKSMQATLSIIGSEEEVTADWGIGAGCCHVKPLVD